MIQMKFAANEIVIIMEFRTFGFHDYENKNIFFILFISTLNYKICIFLLSYIQFFFKLIMKNNDFFYKKKRRSLLLIL